MPDATVTSKGQITIPSEIRRAFGIEPGHQLVFFTKLDGGLGVRVRQRRKGAASGVSKDPAYPPLSQTELRESVGEAVAEGVGERGAPRRRRSRHADAAE